MSFLSSLAYSGGYIESKVLPFNLNSYGFNTKLFPFCNVEWPVFSVIFYIWVCIAFQPSKEYAKEVQKQYKKRSRRSTKPSISFSSLLLSAHNLFLCFFSFMCCWNIWPLMYHWIFTIGWQNATCNKYITSLYNMQSSYGYWVFLFYLSKYYEFIDTWIVIWKRRRPIFLQLFHHIGACFSVWIVLCVRSSCAYGIAVNSFIHTIMYAYYAITVWKIKIPLKWMLTVMQLAQFVFSIYWTFLNISFKCLPIGDQFCSWYNGVYLSVLVVLFARFFRKSYFGTKKIEKKKK